MLVMRMKNGGNAWASPVMGKTNKCDLDGWVKRWGRWGVPWEGLMGCGCNLLLAGGVRR